MPFDDVVKIQVALKGLPEEALEAAAASLKAPLVLAPGTFPVLEYLDYEPLTVPDARDLMDHIATTLADLLLEVGRRTDLATEILLRGSERANFREWIAYLRRDGEPRLMVGDPHRRGIMQPPRVGYNRTAPCSAARIRAGRECADLDELARVLVAWAENAVNESFGDPADTGSEHLVVDVEGTRCSLPPATNWYGVRDFLDNHAPSEMRDRFLSVLEDRDGVNPGVAFGAGLHRIEGFPMRVTAVPPSARWLTDPPTLFGSSAEAGGWSMLLVFKALDVAHVGRFAIGSVDRTTRVLSARTGAVVAEIDDRQARELRIVLDRHSAHEARALPFVRSVQLATEDDTRLLVIDEPAMDQQDLLVRLAIQGLMLQALAWVEGATPRFEPASSGFLPTWDQVQAFRAVNGTTREVWAWEVERALDEGLI